jgi:Zn-dependent protease with chaperone function
MLSAWHGQLEEFSARLGMKRTPRFLVKRSRFHRAWIVSSLGKRPGAWAGLGRIVVSTELLEASSEVRAYLIAHELGHVFKKHSSRVLVPWCVAVVLAAFLMLTKQGGVELAFGIRALMSGGWCCSAAYMLWASRGFHNEYEADAVAVELIGIEAVVRGIRVMADHEGGLTPKRKARLKALEMKSTVPNTKRLIDVCVYFGRSVHWGLCALRSRAPKGSPQ